MHLKLTLRTVNSSRSAYAFFEFNRTFFTIFEPELSKKSRLNNTTLNNTTLADQSYLNQNNDESFMSSVEPFKCKIPARVNHQKLGTLKTSNNENTVQPF